MLNCPKCRKSDLTLSEMWKDFSIDFDFVNGTISDKGYKQEGIPYKVVATCCDCRHSWTLRGITQITDLQFDEPQK